MNVSRRVSLKQNIFGATLAGIGASLAMLLAFPDTTTTRTLELTTVLAGNPNQTRITQAIRLTNALVLEAGATIQAAENSDGPNDAADRKPDAAPAQALLLRDATFTIEQAASVNGHDENESAQQQKNYRANALVRKIRSLGFTKLRAENTIVQLKRPGGRLRQLGLLNATFLTDPDSGVRLSGEGTLTRDGKTVKFRVAAKTSKKDDVITPFEGSLIASDFNLKLNGKLKTTGGTRVTSEDAQFETKDLKKVLAWLGMGPIQSRGLSQFKAHGALTWTGTTIAFDQAKFTLDNHEATGRLSFHFERNEPAIEGTLAFETLDMANYLGEFKQPTATQVLSRLWNALRSTVAGNALPLGFKNIDADLRLSTKSMHVSSTEIGSIAAVIIVKDGKLKADLVDIKLANELKGRAHVEIDVTGFLPTYILSGNFQGVDLGTASSHWIGIPVVDGVADLTFDLSAQGRTTHNLVKTLSGPIAITANNGASVPIDIVKLFKHTQDTPNDGWGKFEGGFTALRDLSVELMSSQGSLETRSVKAHVDGNDLIATGTLKLSDLVLDLVLTKLAATEAGAQKSALDDPPAPQHRNNNTLQFKGPITEPVIRSVSGSRRG